MPLTSRRWFLPAAIAAGWTAVALISTGLSYSVWQAERLRIDFVHTLLVTMPFWLYWPLVTPLIVWLARREPIEHGRIARGLMVHLLASVVICALHVLIYLKAYHLWFPWPEREPVPSFGVLAASYLRNRWQFELLTYWAILGGVLAVRYYREGRERALRAGALEAQLAQAQLQALRMQLNPHFLFNTLQAISVLVVEQPRSAQRMLTLLGDLLRAVLEGGGRQEIPLREELDFLRRYLEIEQVRFPDRLDVRYEVEPGLDDALVPSFVLQPLVENSIRYAIAPRAERGTLVIGARVTEGVLRLSVRDDGPGFPALFEEGVGLSTTRARLEKLYGGDRLDIRGLPTHHSPLTTHQCS